MESFTIGSLQDLRDTIKKLELNLLSSVETDSESFRATEQALEMYRKELQEFEESIEDKIRLEVEELKREDLIEREERQSVFTSTQ